MAAETRRGDRGRGAEAVPTASETAGAPIGEDRANEFAGDVADAGDGETRAQVPGGRIAGAAGGGTGVGDLAGGTRHRDRRRRGRRQPLSRPRRDSPGQ